MYTEKEGVIKSLFWEFWVCVGVCRIGNSDDDDKAIPLLAYNNIFNAYVRQY